MAFEFGKPVVGEKVDAVLMQELLEALATHHATSDPDIPPDPRDGMLRIFSPVGSTDVSLQLYWDGAWITLITNISATSGVATYKAADFPSGTLWSYAHNLGKYPLTQTLYTTGDIEVFIPYRIVHASVNNVLIYNSTAVAGKVIVVG